MVGKQVVIRAPALSFCPSDYVEINIMIVEGNT